MPKDEKEKKPEYTEVDKLKDQLTLAKFMGLQNQLRALNAEIQVISTALQQGQPEAQAAEKRLNEDVKKTKD